MLDSCNLHKEPKYRNNDTIMSVFLNINDGLLSSTCITNLGNDAILLRRTIGFIIIGFIMLYIIVDSSPQMFYLVGSV